MFRKQILVALGIAAVVLLTLVFVLPSAAQQEPPCLPWPQCYEIPTLPGFPGNQPTPAPTAAAWLGASDGRLNPHPAEYYSLWCKNTFLEIWRGVPDSSLLQFVPIWLLEDLDVDGGAVTIPNYGATPFEIVRYGDTLTVSGNFGNLQPAEGEKAFSLTECIERDGHTAEERGSGADSDQYQYSTGVIVYHCYSRDSEAVRQGRIPADRICDY